MTKQNLDAKRKAKKLALLNKTNPLYKHYTTAIEALNKEFIITDLSVSSLNLLRETCKKKDPEVKISVSIPNATGTTIRQERRKSVIVEMLKQSTRTDLYGSSLGNCISSVEYFLSQVIIFVLKKYPQKLTMDASQTKQDKAIPLKSVLEASSIEELQDSIIKERVVSLFYASPADYIKYFNKVCSTTIPDDVFYKYIEVKATRDLIVHNSKRVNEVYISKTGDYARCTDTRQNIPVNKEYYQKSVSNMKSLVKTVYIETTKKIVGITKLEDMFIN